MTGHGIDPALGYLKEFVMQNAGQRRHHSNIAARKLSQPRNPRTIDAAENNTHNKELDLYHNRVLIQRQGTRQLERTKVNGVHRVSFVTAESPNFDTKSRDGP